MGTDTVAESRSNGRAVLLGALVFVFGAKVLGFVFQELSSSVWWQNPIHRDLFATVIIVALGAGAAVGLVHIARRAVGPVVVRLIERWTCVDGPVAEETPRWMTPENEEKTMAHLLETFRLDVFQIYVGPGLKAVPGRDLPESLEKLRDSKQKTKCAEFAWNRAKSRLDDRLRDIQNDWELRPEALERLDREVKEGGQILVTCHSSMKSWH